MSRILSSFLAKQTVLISHDEFGKPFIADEDGPTISYAHSKTQLVVIIDFPSKALGIDTESLQRLQDIAELKNSAFSPSELKHLEDNSYVSAWCLKEAAVKQLGTGFREADPRQFSIETQGKSYKLYLDDKEVSQGYFLDIHIGDDVIVLCSERPVTNLFMRAMSLSTITKGQV